VLGQERKVAGKTLTGVFHERKQDLDDTEEKRSRMFTHEGKRKLGGKVIGVSDLRKRRSIGALVADG